MVERSWRWYLLGDKWDRPQKESHAPTNADKPTANVSKCVPSKSPSCQDGTEKAKHQAAERDFWRKQLCVGRGLNLITFVAAIAAIVGLIFVAKGLSEARRATVEANRAWLTVVNIKFQRGLDAKEGRPVLAGLFQNIGRDPAMDIKTGGGWYPITLIKPLTSPDTFPEIVGGWGALSKSIKDGCWANKPEIGNVIIAPLPSAASSFTIANPNPLPMTQPITIDHTQILVASGCLTYRTFDAVRHTSFCQYWRPSPDSGMEFASCRGGNFAE
jgi:hypothetical protein